MDDEYIHSAQHPLECEISLKSELVSAIMDLTEQECESLLTSVKRGGGHNEANRVLPGA